MKRLLAIHSAVRSGIFEFFFWKESRCKAWDWIVVGRRLDRRV